jgi:formamidopyrimidine-DNA glycosylase
VSKQRLSLLVCAIKQVLAEAIAQGGTTLRNFVDSDGTPGYFKQRLQVYGRTGKPCRGCGEPLKEVRLGQRSTVYCRHCQR